MALSWIIIAFASFINTVSNEEPPQYKGGARGLSSFITNNLIYPEYSKQNCLQGTIEIAFRLDHKGKIVSSKVEKGFGIDLDVEALRIVRLSSGRWNVPASFDTTQSIVMPINFTLKEYNCNQVSPDDIRTAIAAYKANQDLTKAIFNFYDKKRSSAVSEADEARILELKAQLGYDERFVERRVKQAERKLKQGDKESACEDFNFVRSLGSDKADKLIQQNCR